MMPFPYSFPFLFEGNQLITAADSGTGKDKLLRLIGKAGTDIKLKTGRGPAEIPHKEISL